MGPTLGASIFSWVHFCCSYFFLGAFSFFWVHSLISFWVHFSFFWVQTRALAGGLYGGASRAEGVGPPCASTTSWLEVVSPTSRAAVVMADGSPAGARRSKRHEKRIVDASGVEVNAFLHFARTIMGCGENEGEVRNHEGNGFCWGSATLAGFGAGIMHTYKVTPTPFSHDPPRANADDRLVESVARDSCWQLIPKPSNRAARGTLANTVALEMNRVHGQGTAAASPGACLHKMLTVRHRSA